MILVVIVVASVVTTHHPADNDGGPNPRPNDVAEGEYHSDHRVSLGAGVIIGRLFVPSLECVMMNIIREETKQAYVYVPLPPLPTRSSQR